MFKHSGRDRRSLHMALGLVLAGALGNLYDRTFVIADVIKDFAAGGRPQYHVGTILKETPQTIQIVEGLLHQPTGAELAEAARYARIVSTKSVIDRRRQGVVRDFIKMEPRIGDFQVWPWVFNLADTWLVIGVGLLLLNFWWDRKAERAAAAEASAGSTP
ncbi:MAG: signal peptidase II [Phycisphaerae bacterium]